MVKAIICALSLLPLTFALGLINDGRVHHHSPLFHHRAHTRISQTRYNPSRKNKSCIYQSENSNDYFLEKVEEKSVLEEMQESFMELKEKASKALTRAQNDELSELEKLGFISKFLLLRLTFTLYRVYRGFFVLLPALIFSIIKDIRAESVKEAEYYKEQTWFQKLLLRFHTRFGKSMREKVVEKYFEGVTEKNAVKIASCFAEEARIRDVCNLSGNSKLVRLVTPNDLTERCMEFLAAHPDAVVEFYYPPRCGAGVSRWVFTHWFETGTWKGKSCGIEPSLAPLDVEGQTRFIVNDDLLIEELVVTRTFSDWEKELYERRSK